VANNFEVIIKLKVTCSQDVTAKTLEGHLRLPNVQSKICASVSDLLPLLETKERHSYHSYDCVSCLVTVEAVA
jgi:hypothetical protein